VTTFDSGACPHHSPAGRKGKHKTTTTRANAFPSAKAARIFPERALPARRSDPDFLRAATAGRRAVARLGNAAAKALQTTARTVQISGQTAAKQRARSNLDPEDYALVQRILDEGALFLEADGLNMQGFIEADGRLWKAVVKTTRKRDELFLTTLHRAQDRDRLKASSALKWIVAGNEGEG